MSKIKDGIIDAEWSDCLRRLRDARALVLRDAESFHEAAITLERVGQVLSGRIKNGLGSYRSELLELASSACSIEPPELQRLFEIVRESRNMAVHDGAWARHLNSRLVDFMLILEQAIMEKLQCASDLMVRQPLTAELWHLVSQVRQAMLSNSYSSLPIFFEDRWHILTDQAIMDYIYRASDKRDKKERLSAKLETAIQTGEIKLLDASCFNPEAKLVDIVPRMVVGPGLIVEDRDESKRLVGILTPFDVL